MILAIGANRIGQSDVLRSTQRDYRARSKAATTCHVRVETICTRWRSHFSYGADVPDVYRRAAGVVDKILRGTSPDDIPVERPTLFSMGVNLKTAKALGVTIPDRIRKQAVEIIE
jgi:putative ABC transport system substrate-binding protein